jgi:hypothetical protein
MSNRDDFDVLADELATQYGLSYEATRRIAIELHNAKVAGEEQAEREAHRSGAIEALSKARLLACHRCASNVPLLNERVHAGKWSCGAVEVRRLLEEYAKPTTEAPCR